MGRPRVVPGEESARIFATVSVDQKAKYQRLGDAVWLREKINKAKEKSLSKAGEPACLKEKQ